MASTAYRGLDMDSPAQADREDAEDDELSCASNTRYCKARNRAASDEFILPVHSLLLSCLVHTYFRSGSRRPTSCNVAGICLPLLLFLCLIGRMDELGLRPARALPISELLEP